MTLTEVTGPLALTLVSLLAACGGGSVRVPDGPVRLAEMRADSRPYYWVGDSFNELELTHAEPYEGRFANVIYGTCEVPTGLFAEGGCAPPLSVQNVLCEDGSVNVALFGDGGGRAARAAKALRPLNEAARRAGAPTLSFDRSLLC
jgi:hypothetical protein